MSTRSRNSSARTLTLREVLTIGVGYGKEPANSPMTGRVVKRYLREWPSFDDNTHSPQSPPLEDYDSTTYMKFVEADFLKFVKDLNMLRKALDEVAQESGKPLVELLENVYTLHIKGPKNELTGNEEADDLIKAICDAYWHNEGFYDREYAESQIGT
jgi:hypothetical protein